MALVVAEISGNHGGDLEKAEALISAAATAGAPLVKFQYYLPEDMPDADKDDNRAMYEKLHVPHCWLSRLFRVASLHGIGLFASVFSVRAVEELKSFRPPFYKFASPDSTPLLTTTYRQMESAIAATAPIIVSRPLRLVGELTLSMNRYVHGDFGLSDHGLGLGNCMDALTRGASMIERHFKLDEDCVDAEFSSTQEELSVLCRVAHHV